MPAVPNPIIVRSARRVTHIGLVPEQPGKDEPILIHEVVCRSTMRKEIREDIMGDILGIRWGNVSAEWALEVEQLEQRGVSDSFPGRLSPSVLLNLDKPEFGCLPSSGLFLFMGGERTRRGGGRLPHVRFTVTADNIRSSAGSPDGASTPSITTGGSTGTKPAITYAGPLTGTKGSAVDVHITTTGTATVALNLAEGQILPAGLSINHSNNHIEGTPSVEADYFVLLVASNAYGTTSRLVEIRITAAVPTPVAPANAYVRWIYTDGGGDHAYQAHVYSALSGPPTDLAAFLAATSLSTSVESLGGGATRQITEILGFPTPGISPVYWYRKNPAVDGHLIEAWNGGFDPVTWGEGDVDPGIDPLPPADPADDGWPGTRKSSDRIKIYARIRFPDLGIDFINAYGGTFPFDVDAITTPEEFLTAAGETAGLVWDDMHHRVLVELFKVGTGYLHQADPDAVDGMGIDTAISDALDDDKSPVYHASTNTREGAVLTNAVIVAPAQPTPDPTLGSDDPDLHGPAPNAAIANYFLVRSLATGRYYCHGKGDAGHTPTTLQEFVNAENMSAQGIMETQFDEVSNVSQGVMLIELWRVGVGYLFRRDEDDDNEILHYLESGVTPVDTLAPGTILLTTA